MITITEPQLNDMQGTLNLLKVEIGAMKDIANNLVQQEKEKKERQLLQTINTADASSDDLIITDEDSSENIYDLFSQYTNYVQEIFDTIINMCLNMHKPCFLEILDEHIYHNKNPIVIGVKVVKGTLHNNIQVKSNDTGKLLGTIVSIEKDSKPLQLAKENDRVCLKINSKLSYNSDMKLLKTYYTKEEKHISKKI